MPRFFTNKNFSRGDLSLRLSNVQGHAQDGFDVRWTVFAQGGLAASGRSLPATRASTGEYFAPWGCALAGGCYRIVWEYGAGPGLPRQSHSQSFVVFGGSGGCCSSSPKISIGQDCHGVFYSGQTLGPDNLRLLITDDFGLPSSAFIVFWTIVNCHGCPVSPRSQASSGSMVGEYFASWTAGYPGSFSVRWEWMISEDSPMESFCSQFSVVSAPGILSRCEAPVSFNCCPPPPVSVIVVKECSPSSLLIPRTVVLPSQVLPAGGAFTNQAAFLFQPAIRHITFYIKYTHGVPGGFPVLRLMWGNGFEEIASTVINSSLSSSDNTTISQEMRISDLLGPIPDSDAPEFFMLETSVPGGSTYVRLLIAESGVIGIPGTAEITLTGSSD